jgi:hypothetical protein
VTIVLRKPILALLVTAILGPLSASTVAAPQEPGNAPPVSLERVRDGLNRMPSRSLRFDSTIAVPAATFRVTVTGRPFVIPIMDSLRKEFELTPLQRQSADWSSKCCGLSLAMLTDGLERAFRRWEERRVHDRVARELAEVVAAANK